jgi:hypothetical protein
MPSVLSGAFTAIIGQDIFGNLPSHGIIIEDSFPPGQRAFEAEQNIAAENQRTYLAIFLTHLNYTT